MAEGGEQMSFNAIKTTELAESTNRQLNINVFMKEQKTTYANDDGVEVSFSQFSYALRLLQDEYRKK